MDDRSTDNSACDRPTIICPFGRNQKLLLCKGHSPIVSREEASPFPDDLCLSGETDEETEITGEDSAQEIVGAWVEKAQEEELGGCPALAETYWREAFLSSQSPLASPQLSSQVSTQFGVFLCKFLPSWEHPAYYFRSSLVAERFLEPSSKATQKVALRLARCLASSDSCVEAETVLAAIDPQDEEIRIRARALLGRTRGLAGDLLQSAAILSDTVRTAKMTVDIDSEALAEVITDFAETLLEAEKWTEAEREAWEAVEVAERSTGAGLARALRVAAAVCAKTGKIEELKVKFEAVVHKLRSARCHPYVEAEVLTILADAALPHQPELSVSLYEQALRLYKSVKATSWYVACILTKLHRIVASPAHSSNLQSELSEVMDQLPDSSILAACSDCEKCVQKLISRVSTEPEDASTGEMLVHLCRLCAQQPAMRGAVWRHVAEYLACSPSTRVAAKLHSSIADWKAASACEKESTLQKSLELHKSLSMAPNAVAALLRRIAALREGQIAGKIREQRLDKEEQIAAFAEVSHFFEEAVAVCRASAELSTHTGESLKLAAFFHNRRRNYEKAEECLKQALAVFSAINEFSSKSADVMTSLSELYERMEDGEEAERWMRRAMQGAWRQNPASQASATAFAHMLTHFDLNERKTEAINLYSDYCQALKGRFPWEFRARSQEFVSFLLEKGETTRAKSHSKQCLLSCLDSIIARASDLLSTAASSQSYMKDWCVSQKLAVYEAAGVLRAMLEKQRTYTEVERVETVRIMSSGNGRECLRSIRSCYRREESA